MYMNILAREIFIQYHQVVPPPALETKYETLFKKYECFTKVQTFVPRHPRPPPVPKRPLEKKKRSLQSLWNILNETNYLKVAHKLRFMVQDDNVQHTVEDLVKHAILHVSYRKYFLLVLQDMHKHHAAYPHVQALYRNFLSSQDYLLKVPADMMTEYDLFCHRQKKKQHIVNSTLLYLDLSSFVSIDIGEYAASITDCIVAQTPELDLYIQVLIEICKVYPELKPRLDWRALIAQTTSSKTKFLIEKLL